MKSVRVLVEYDLEVEGKCIVEDELLKHLSYVGTPVDENGNFAILANSIEIKQGYEELQAENEGNKAAISRAVDIANKLQDKVNELEDLRDIVQINCNPPDDCNDPIVLKNYMKGCLEQALKGG